MEGREIDYQSPSTNTKVFTLEEQLDELCSYYMAIGVPYNEFWYGDYTKLKYYDEAHKKKIEQTNQELWMQGLYFYNALGVCLSNAFSKRNAKKQEYIKEPLRIFPKTEMEKEQEKEQERLKAIKNFELMRMSYQAKKKKEQK